MQITRNPTRSVRIGLTVIGADHPVAVQSMTATHTQNIDATVEQVNALHAAGADVVRVAVDNTKDAAALADGTWRDEMKASGEARTQAFARRLIAGGYHGLLVRSFAPGAAADDLNLVLWKWGDAAPARVILVDDENRLSR